MHVPGIWEGWLEGERAGPVQTISTRPFFPPRLHHVMLLKDAILYNGLPSLHTIVRHPSESECQLIIQPQTWFWLLAVKLLAIKLLATKLLAIMLLAFKNLAIKLLAAKLLSIKLLAIKLLAFKLLANKLLATKFLAIKLLAVKLLASKLLAIKL
jgi:hypothetical protein